ncbi:SRPBCC family protein [Streptomyces sp. NPDC046866]|uniref:SRPBCC family protein n=1 Tax=Streptomyces sp. NPDC046866 TaxID=3154921 RepID=UPI003455464B
MATTDRARSGGTRSPMDQLLEELGGYLSAQADQLADKAADKLGDFTDQLSDVAENGGSLADIGGRMLKGDSPLKAVAGGTLGGLKDKVKDLGSGLLGGGGGKKRKSGSKPTHIAESVDVGVPLRTAYNHWTRYEEFSSFAKGVRSVSQGDDTTSDWKVKVGPSTRSWKATVQEQVPDERIMWSSEGAKGTTRGCVSFHELAPSLTRVLLVVEYYPSGFFEKTGNLWRAQGRRMRLDLKHFVRHVTLAGDEEPEGWRGEIRDGEVVRTHEEAVEEEESSDGESEEAEDYEGEQDEGDYPEDEDQDEDEEYEEDGADEDDEDDEGDAGEDEEEGTGEPEDEYDDEYEDEDEDEEGEEQDEEDEEDEEDEDARRPRRRRSR